MKYFSLFIFLSVLIFIFFSLSREKKPILLVNTDDDRYYMEKLKKITNECREGFKIDRSCLNEMIKMNIPSKYYVHVRYYEDDKVEGIEFACIDTTLSKNEELLKKAKKLMAGE
jgi:hypothetical protein